MGGGIAAGAKNQSGALAPAVQAARAPYLAASCRSLLVGVCFLDATKAAQSAALHNARALVSVESIFRLVGGMVLANVLRQWRLDIGFGFLFCLR